MAPSAVTAESAVDSRLLTEKRAGKKTTELSSEHDIVLKTFRLLIADLCQQFGGGHPGYVFVNL